MVFFISGLAEDTTGWREGDKYMSERECLGALLIDRSSRPSVYGSIPYEQNLEQKTFRKAQLSSWSEAAL